MAMKLRSEHFFSLRSTRFVATVLTIALLATSCSADASDEADSGDAGYSDASGDEAGSGDAEYSDSPSGTEARASDDDSAGAATEESAATTSDEASSDDASEASADESGDEDSSDAMLDESSKAAPSDSTEDREIEDEPTTVRPQAGLLSAGDIDDNLNHVYFQRLLGGWISEQGQNEALVQLDDRMIVDVVGANGAGVGNTAITISDGQTTRTVVANSLGRAHVYPGWLGLNGSEGLVASVGEQTAEIGGNGPDQATLTIDGDTSPPSKLDLALVLDVTGSMADELNYLTVEFESIIERVESDYGRVDMRFSLVVYRDEGDDFVTRTFDFTDDPQQMRSWLSDQRADGGGDFPEAMDQALVDAEDFEWRTGDDVARVLILNADAPPQPQNISRTFDSSRQLAENGVRIYPLAASGVDRSAEFLMRTMAATSGGRHMFLTGDSGIGGSKLEPKAECYLVTDLDDLLYRVLATELAGERIEPAPAQVIRTVGDYDRGECS